MVENQKINFRKYAPEKVSKRYLIRIVVYIVIFTVAGIFIYSGLRKKEGNSLKRINEIHNITIEQP